MKEHLFAKYLSRCPQLPDTPELANFRRAVVIPAYKEDDYLFDCLASLEQAAEQLPEDDPAAVIVVVNYPWQCRDWDGRLLYEKLLISRLKGRIKLFALYAGAVKAGVGEARKMGMDWYVRNQTSQTADDRWLWSLDADCLVSENYFKLLRECEFSADLATGGAVLAFRHRNGETCEQEMAIRQYEEYLFEYEAILKRCGSVYAYTAIGSAFGARVCDYIRSGGMKLKTAGEDFYFLQELRKCTGFLMPEEIAVYPSARYSCRTAFGTGQAVSALAENRSKLRWGVPEFEEALGELLTLQGKPGMLKDAAFFLRHLANESSRKFLEAEGFLQLWDKIVRNQPDRDRDRQQAFARWFDGLKTRRFLHYILDKEK